MISKMIVLSWFDWRHPEAIINKSLRTVTEQMIVNGADEEMLRKSGLDQIAKEIGLVPWL